MKIAYLLGKGSKHDNIELRWSLRSIAKHGRNIEEVIVIGENPGFLSDKVHYVPFEEKTRIKHANMCAKVLYLIRSGICTKEFLLSSDDHIYVKDVDFDNYPIYIRGEMKPEHEYKEPINKYRRSCIDTRTILEEFGLPTHCFHGHVNTHIFPEYADKVEELLNVTPSARYGYEVTELFTNLYAAYNSFDAVVRPDIKINEFTTEEELVKRIDARDCFSFGDPVFYKKSEDEEPEPSGFAELMDKWFPDKCIYEV